MNMKKKSDNFKDEAVEIINWIDEYLRTIEKYPVLSKTDPGDLIESIPASAPEHAEELNNILKEFDEKIIPAVTHWNHPMFMAYFNSTSGSPGIFAEFIIAALNQNGMNWKSSPAAAELERVTMNWFRQTLNLPDDFWGIIYDTASVSSMHAIAAAREKYLQKYNFREDGFAGNKDIPPLRIYMSEQAHSSIEKGALTLGFGLKGIRKIPVDENFRMIPSELKKAILEDKKKGSLPVCVAATIGTTSTTSADPVKEISKICKEENVWLHVDAAFAGVTAMLPECKIYFEGWEDADSIVVNPHKWLFIPIDISIFYTKHPEVLKRAFSLVPEYLKTESDEEAENLMDYGIQLGRRFRSLKLWFTLKYFGVHGLQEILREHIRLGNLFKDWIDTSANFERLAPAPFSVVCFRAVPDSASDVETINEFNERLMRNINSTGKLFLSHTKLNGKFTIRLVVSGIRQEEQHVKEAWKIIQEEFEKLRKVIL